VLTHAREIIRENDPPFSRLHLHHEIYSDLDLINLDKFINKFIRRWRASVNLMWPAVQRACAAPQAPREAPHARPAQRAAQIFGAHPCCTHSIQTCKSWKRRPLLQAGL